MNAELIMQIVREFAEIPDQQLSFGSLYSKTSSSRWSKGVEHFGPLGHHIRKHPKLKPLLGVKLITDEYPYAPTIAEMLKSKEKTFTIKREWWAIDNSKLEEYLDLGCGHIKCLFWNSRFTRQEFVDTVNAFAKGELDIRECRGDECGIVYTTEPIDKACVCPDCKEHMLEMCGL